MNITDVISGRAGIEGIQRTLLGAPMRRALRRELGAMLGDAGMPGPCRLRRAKYKPGRHLTAYFDVGVPDEGAGGNSTRPIEVSWRLPGADDPRGPMPALLEMEAEAKRAGLCAPFAVLTGEAGELGMRIQVSPLDVRFPQLVKVSTPGHATDMLSMAFTQGNGHADAQGAAAYTVSTIRYRPGQRHVLRYDPHSATGSARGIQPGSIFAKLYRDDTGVRALRIAGALADWLDACEAPVSAVRPVAYLRDDAVVLYPRVPGTPLSGQLGRPVQQAGLYLAKLGAALRMLHSAPAELTAELQPHDFDHEINAISRACEHIRILLPGVGVRIDSILDDRARELHARFAGEPLAFAHGDLKADHLLVTQSGRPVMIDFDTCYLADPAIDIGKFLADLQWWYAEYGKDGVEQAQQLFLEAYSAGVPDERMVRARLYEALVLIKITARRVRLFSSDWAAKTERLIERAGALMDRALVASGAGG